MSTRFIVSCFPMGFSRIFSKEFSIQASVKIKTIPTYKNISYAISIPRCYVQSKYDTTFTIYLSAEISKHDQNLTKLFQRQLKRGYQSAKPISNLLLVSKFPPNYITNNTAFNNNNQPSMIIIMSSTIIILPLTIIFLLLIIYHYPLLNYCTQS